MNTLKEFKIEYAAKMLNVHSLNVDYSYQRPETNIIEVIAQDFNSLAFGRICVGQRKDGTYWIVDGQQRTAAAKLINKVTVPCDIFQSTGPKMEATIFQQINKNRKKVTPGEVFKAGLKSGQKFYLDIDTIVKANDFEIVFDGNKHVKWPKIYAIGMLERIHREENLHKTLNLIRIVWNNEPEALKESFLYAVSLFIKLAGAKLDTVHMFKNFSKILPSEIDLLARKDIIATPYHGYMRYQAILKQLVKIYNKRAKVKIE